MNAYLETSAVLSWILQEPDGAAVENCLRQAKVLSTSELTLAECQRALRRLGSPSHSPVSLRLQAFQALWNQVPITSRLLELVGQSFPVEPLRTLDAIHIVTAVDLRPAMVELHMISLDRRVRENASALGFPVLP